MLKHTFPSIALAALSGCGSGISGEYGGPDCLLGTLKFADDGIFYLKIADGMEARGQYVEDGDRVSVSIPGGTNMILTKNGDALEGPPELASATGGMKMECKKL